MKKTNIEKELNKIQHPNRNKIIVGICSLLLIIAIGSTFALYQVRHTNKLVFNTVSEFVKKDITVSVLIDDESKPEFPAKEDGYLYSGYECENDGVITFDDEQWKFTLENNKPDKCVIKFTSKPFNSYVCKDLAMSECLLLEDQHINKELAYDDPDGNARYYGKDPSNYIWFNCDDYSNPTEETCERWRIIGSFKNIEKITDINGTTENQNLVKIMRNESIGNYPYDNKDISTGAENDTYGKNDWTEARLMMLLNPGYESEEIGGSLYYDWSKAQSGQCYRGAHNGTVECNFSKTGLKNDITRSMIENVFWHLGAIGSESNYYHNSVASEFYTKERGNTPAYTNRVTIWPTKEQLLEGKVGKIAIIYSSDYGYATGGGQNQNRQACLNIPLYHWAPSSSEEIHTDNYPDCYNNNWIFKLNYEELFLTPGNTTFNVYGSTTNGRVHNRGAINATNFNIIRPTLYLNHDTKISGGDGTYENPYTIAIQ